ncbi:hypothetical protein HAX54_011922 [Datura stramonium]|uniref:Uncharacterized protein n=1 Tax=Datura stramonium TaxID=4076 RepID=A0ABS8TKV7_DATST|nr:hypothetical protein [Datura stramonium]
MTSLEARRLLELAILDYLSKRGFHQTGATFSNEIRANQNLVAINSPHEAFLQAWWEQFYKRYNSSFPDAPVFAVESFDKVAQTVENVVGNNNPENQSYAPDLTGANISNVMPESSSPDLMDATVSALLSSFDAGYELLDLSPQRDMTSGLHFPKMSEMGRMLPFAINSGAQMQQMPTVPPEWNARVDIPDTNMGGPMRMEPNIYAAVNALPTLPELSDAGNNRSLQQASHQGWPSAMLGETNQRTLENLPSDQQIIAPIGGIMKSSGKQPAVQEQINQLGLQSSNKIGIKRKTPLSSLAPVGKEKATVAGFAVPAHTQAEQKGNSFEEISSLHIKNSKLLRCHFNSKGDLLATAGHNRKVLIWELGNNSVYSGEGHAHHITDIRFRPNSTVFATSSFDRTVKIWDAAKPRNPFQNLVGHVEHVMSIDFHPTKAGLLSSCDSNDDIILWDVCGGDCKLIFKGGSRHVRFQPRLGDLLASSTGNIINIFDVETNSIQKKLQGHVKDVRSICWDMSGNYLASVSEDSARIWSVSEGKCLHELCSSGNKFQSCTFRPGHSQVLVIGSFEFLELWNPTFQGSLTRSYSAHDGIISSLVDSPSKGTIASVSDEWVKIWR